MAMTPRQLLAFGDLYLNEGQTRDGTRILSPEWVRETFVARVASPRERGRFYGYGWWIRDMAGYATHYAWGYGGQFVFVVPGLDLVVVTTSDPNPGDDRRGHLQRIYDLVEEHVVRLLGGNGAP
jgi:CubicO group peptidase (beta-lactamase class C family)